jgi:hypothetical protein
MSEPSLPPVEPKHLVGPVTFRGYLEARIGALETLPQPLRDRLLEKEREVAQRLQAGEELWEWAMSGEEIGHCTGLALLREGVISTSWMFGRSEPPKRTAPPGSTTALQFYENHTPAEPGQLQRSRLRSFVETPLRPAGVEKTLLLDPAAETLDLARPAFLAAPPGAPAYHGFPLLDELRTGGWCLGAVTDPFESDSEEGCTIGDLFVEAPDGRRAGLSWNVDPSPRFAVLQPPSGNRWGVLHFTFSSPIRDMAGLKEAFAAMLPVLQQVHARAHAGR